MYFFISERRNVNNEEPEIRTTNSYIEIESQVDDESSIFTYIIPRNENSAFVAICLDDMFDNMLENLDEDSFETISNT